jgi:hypothetical protein
VTACAATCLQADVAAKAAFLLGHAGPAFLDERGLAGRFLGNSGEIVCTRRWPSSDRSVNGFEWEAARAGGIVAYVLLSAVVVIGLALAGKERLEGWPRFAIEDVHRFAGMLVGSFVALHVLTIAIDSQAHFSFVQLVVPFALLVALAIANHYRKRISCRLWRRLHYLNFAVWLAATWHGIGAGTDSGSAWLLWIYVGAIGVVALLTARRILRAAPPVSA